MDELPTKPVVCHNTPIRFKPLNSDELGKLLHYMQTNHSADAHTCGRLVQRCRPFLTAPEHIVMAIEIDSGATTTRWDAHPEWNVEDLSMYDHIMAWLKDALPPHPVMLM